ncbi:MAG: Gfo/Idh/MocA family oxidoreductase [Bacteroidales bacterium]
MARNTTRRDFVRRSAAVVAGAFALPTIVPASALGLGGKTPPSDMLVMGIIGTGSQGMSDARDFMRLNKQVRFVALCDVDSKRLAAAKETVDKENRSKDSRTYGDYREFMAKETLDAVLIALPDHWHGIIYTEAANKGWDVYGEKPICRTIKDGQTIVAAVKKNNIIWQTGSWQRSQENFRKGAELAINGRVGKIKTIEVGLPDGGRGIGTPPVQDVPAELNWEMWLGPAPKVPYRGVSHWNWRWILDYSGGQLTDWAGHHIDIANWGAGLEFTGPVTIEGRGVYPPEGIYNAPVEYDFLCTYENGIVMRVANSSRFPMGMGTTWYGDLGWIHVDRGGKIAASDPKILEEVIGENEIHLYKSTNHYQNFVDCVKSRKQTIAPIEPAYRAISVGLLGEIAMTTGQKIYWDPVREIILDNPVATRLLSRPYRKPWALPIA